MFSFFFFSILQGFYDEVSNPMLIDVELNYPENEISDLTTNSFKHFYDGSEIVVAGRFVDSNQNHLSVDVRGEGVSMDFFDFCKLHKISECFFCLHCDEQKCHVNVKNWVMFCSVYLLNSQEQWDKIPHTTLAIFWCRTRLVFNSIRFSGVKALIFGKFCQCLATCNTENILTPNRLMMPCRTLHSKMLSKQLRLSKNNNTFLESTLKGSGLILPLNNSWKNGNYIWNNYSWNNTLALNPSHPLTLQFLGCEAEVRMGKHKNQ